MATNDEKPRTIAVRASFEKTDLRIIPDPRPIDHAVPPGQTGLRDFAVTPA